MTKQEMQQEALDRAENGQSWSNYPAIIQGFLAKGIPEADIVPRVNVLTFNAWKAKGRSVMKGQHGVKVFTFIEVQSPEKEDGTRETYRRPHTTTVFHISQTELTSEREARFGNRYRGRGRYSESRRPDRDPGYVDLDRAYEDQCADICGR